MKKTFLLLALLISTQLSGHSATSINLPASATLSLVEGGLESPIFGAGKYKKRRIQGQNTPKKINRSNKKSLRKMGMAAVFSLDWKGDRYV